jgi:hypothetical protein
MQSAYTRNAGIVEQDVNAAEAFDNRPGHRFHIMGKGHIRMEKKSALTEFHRYPLAALRIPIDDGNACTFLHKEFRRCFSDTGSSTGKDRCLAF